jgi:hypothetical protein
VKKESDDETRRMKERQQEKEVERQKVKELEAKRHERGVADSPGPSSAAEKESGAEKNEGQPIKKEDTEDKLFPRIDRIILYIDDLDRCPERNVVEVLQAVHLLLAFPLFIVVVGVDPRWLLRSLEIHSAVFSAAAEKAEGRKGRDEDPLWESTPMNYLEKIFQIPFSLRPIDSTGFGKLVDTFAAPREDRNKGKHTPGAAGIPVSQSPPAGVKVGEPAPPPSVAAAAAVGASSFPGSPRQVSPAAVTPSPAQEVSSIASGSQPRQDPPVPPVQTASSPETPAAGRSTSALQAVSTPEPIDRNPEHLHIADSERKFMKTLSELIPSPRAGKRFINIYRLIRASIKESERKKFVDDAGGGEYQAVQLLLAILTGHPAEATEILHELIKEDHAETWGDFLGSLKERIRLATQTASAARQPDSAEAAKAAKPRNCDRAAAPTATAAANLPQDIDRWLELFGKLERRENGLKDRPCALFSKWAREIARYSFQSGRVLLYQRD